MKTLFPILFLLISGCSFEEGNPALSGVVLTTSDGSTAPDMDFLFWEVQGPDAAVPDPDAEVPNQDPDAEVPDPDPDAAAPDPDPDAAVIAPDAELDPLGCLQDGCGQDEVCDQESRLCVPDCLTDPEVCTNQRNMVCDPESRLCVPDCFRNPGVCDPGTLCDAESRLCVLDCYGIACGGATPYCIPPHPPYNIPYCGQCLNDFDCRDDQFCNLADWRCNTRE